MPRLAAALALAALAGCNPTITGDGVLGEQDFTVGPFTGVHVGLGIEATVTAGASPQSVRLLGDENVLPFIGVTVSGNVLTTTLHDTGSVTSQHPLQLVVAVPSLDAVTADGVAASSGVQTLVTASGVAAPSLAVAATGGGQVVVAGAGGSAETVTLSGGATYDGSAYPAAAAAVDLSGGSQARLEVSGVVSGNVSGQSAVLVSGGGLCTATVGAGSSCAPAP